MSNSDPFERFTAWIASELLALEAELRAAKEREIRDRVAWERAARRRPVPAWDPVVDGPQRLLEHCWIAAMRLFAGLRTEHLEALFGRGSIDLVGRRDDDVGAVLPDRIERLIAGAGQVRVCFAESFIVATYAALAQEPRPVIRGREVNRTILFSEVRAHWPQLVAALRELGFALRDRGAQPEEIGAQRRDYEERLRRLADFIFADRAKETREKELRDMAERQRAQLGAFTIRDFALAYRMVYRTEAHRSKRGGWALQPEYAARVKAEGAGKAKALKAFTS